jgi:hypothetical protein
MLLTILLNYAIVISTTKQGGNTMEKRIQELETLLTEQCGKYDSDCTNCPYSKECEEYARLEQLNTMCLTCKKLGTDCKGTTCQTWTGCAMKTM